MSEVETSGFELLMNNMLLKQEQRLTENFTGKLDQQTEKITKTVHDQNQLFSGNILSLTRDVATLEEKLKSMNVKIATVGGVCSALGGIVGFFVSQLL